jgi:WD40 repeat protein
LKQLLTGHDPSSEQAGLLPSRLDGQAGNAELEALIARMLASDPQNRPRSIFQLAHELEHVRQVQRVSQQTHSIWQAPIPQDYTPSAAAAGAQIYLQHATFVQPGLGAALKSATVSSTSKPARHKRLTRRRVLIGIAVGVVVGTAGIGVGIGQNMQADHTIYTYRRHNGVVNSVAWSFDNQRIASASADQSVQTWHAQNGNAPVIHSIYSNAVNSVAYTHSNAYAIGSADTSVQIWSSSEGSLFNRTQVGPVNSVAWSPDGAYLACADAIVSIWNLAQQTSTSPALVESENGIHYAAVAWSPDGRYLASSSSATTLVETWLVSDMTTAYNYTGHTEVINCIAWSPDSTRIAAGVSDSQVLIWEASYSQLLAAYSIPNGSILAIS